MSILDDIRASVVGEGTAIQTPYGVRRMTYTDYTASGRALSFVERYIQEQALPLYGNTHSTSSAVGVNTDALRESARAAIAKYCNTNEQDCVVFCGSGATAAIDKLLRCMGLRRPVNDKTSCWSNDCRKPVVFLGCYEHHSHDLPYRNSYADVVNIEPCQNGLIDLDDLAAKLAQYANRPLKIGAFSAASNVTGILSDVRRIAELLHDHGALAFFDYAAAARMSMST